MRLLANRVLLLVSLSASVALLACASGGGGSASSSSDGAGASAPSSSAAEAPAKPPKGVAAPAGHKLAKVNVGMRPAQVKEIMGEATTETTYMTGKAWIPWYFGPTHQTDWKYKGQGRVVFVNNRWSGQIQSVTRVDYDPGEDGM